MELAVLRGCEAEEDVVISRVPYAIGRCRSADLIIAHVNVSRNHCKIVKEDGLWKIYDFSSSGTYVNEKLVGQGKCAALGDGDRIRFGHLDSNLCRSFHPCGAWRGKGEEGGGKVSGGGWSGEAGDGDVSLKRKQAVEGSEKAHEAKDSDLKFGRTKEKLSVLQESKETNGCRAVNEERRSKENSRAGVGKKVEEKMESEKIEELAKELQQVRKALSSLEEKSDVFQRELNVGTNNKALPSGDKNLLENLTDVMETELQCTICSELFVTAVTLGCTHTFCKYCIDQWKRKQKSCPVCRKKITNETQSLVIDNYIDKMVGNLSVELKERREAIIKERSEIGPFRKRPKVRG